MSEPLMTEFRYELRKSSVTYASGGDTVPASFFVFSAPTSKHSKFCAFLKQAFFRALPRDQEADPDAKFEKPEGAEVITILAMSAGVDLGEVLEIARQLFLAGVAKVDGDAKVTKHLLDQLHQDDFEEMVGEYLVNFTLASALERMSRS